MAIVTLVTGFTLLGEGLNDVINPLIRARRIKKPVIPGQAGDRGQGTETPAKRSTKPDPEPEGGSP